MSLLCYIKYLDFNDNQLHRVTSGKRCRIPNKKENEPKKIQMFKKTKTIQVSKCILVCPFINHTHMYTTLPVLRFLLFHSPVHKFIVCNIFQHSMMTDIIPPHSHHLHKQHIHKILMTISYTLIHQQVVVLHVEQHFSH